MQPRMVERSAEADTYLQSMIKRQKRTHKFKTFLCTQCGRKSRL